MIINQLDLGAPSHPFATPVVGQDVVSVVVEGREPVVWSHGSVVRKQSVGFWLKAWQSLGGGAANSSTATKYLLKQVEELASNRDLQPAYIQWTATADGTAQLNASELHDGWYYIDDFEPNYSHNVITGLVECRMTVTEVAPAAPRSVAMAYAGGALSTNFSGGATNLITLPYGSTALEAAFNRTVAGGLAPPSMLSPVGNPEQMVLSTTIANIFEKGRVAVYDTINTGSNPVPTSGGTYVHANWVEVFYTDHDFVGDCVITNGLQLLLFQTTTAAIFGYLWNTALATANWQKYLNLTGFDVPGSVWNIRSYSLSRIGAEETAIVVSLSSAGGKVISMPIRLQRGRYEVRTDVKELTETNSVVWLLRYDFFNGGLGSMKIAYNDTGVTDLPVQTAGLGPTVAFGYAAGFVASASFPLIAGILYQNFPAAQPSYVSVGMDLGDNSGPALNATRSYGFFAIPYGVSGSYSTANLQAEAESGTLDGGWTSQANASASGGNEAQCAITTPAARADVFGTAFVPDPGTYDVWFRARKVAGGAPSGTAQMQLGLWNSTDSVFVASTTYASNQMVNTFGWFRVATAVTPTATKNMRFRAVTTATVDVTWAIDEAALVPLTLAADHRGPQEVWQQFMYDRSVRLVRS